MLGVLRSSWRRKDKSVAVVEEAPQPRPRQASHTLPRGMVYSDALRDSDNYPESMQVSGRLSRLAEPIYSDVFSAHPEQPKVRPRARSMGAPDVTPSHPFPSEDSGIPELPPLPVTRPIRKSSLVPLSPVRTIFEQQPSGPPVTRMSSTSALQNIAPRPLQHKRSMPELNTEWEGIMEETNVTPSPTPRSDPILPRDPDATPVKGRSRSGSTVSYSSRPPPRSALPSIPSGSTYPPPVDLTSPRKPHFTLDMFASTASRPGTASSLAYLKDGTQSESSHHSHIARYTPDLDDARSSTPGSLYSEDDTLSMFPQPPPLNLRYIPSRSGSPSQYPLTPEYTPTATPTTAAFFQSPSHAKRTTPPTSILKKPSGYLHYLPSPPITPSTPSHLSPSSSNTSFVLSGLEPLAPTLRIRNSSPHLLSARLHSAHRPSSSDSSSDKSVYSTPVERMDYDLRKRAFSRPENPKLLEAFHLAIVEEVPHTRPSSPEPDTHGVQWGYAV